MSWDPAQFEMLFLNAGFGVLQSSASPLLDEVREMFEVNLWNRIHQAQTALSGGAFHVHIVGSVQAFVSSPHLALYSATKHGIRGWAYGSARELPGRVSISYPNGMATSFFTHLKGDPKLMAHYHNAVEKAKWEYDDPKEVAAGILNGIANGAREIIPTLFSLKWFQKNEIDIRRMWHPGLEQPSVEKFDWWEQIQTYAASHL
jgi:short-subunit dehydrogenase